MSMAGSTSKAWCFTEAFERNDERTMTVTDPVCEMQVDIEKAAVQEEHGGWAYFFCSERCHRLFRASPARYMERERRLTASSTAETERSDHGQG